MGGNGSNVGVTMLASTVSSSMLGAIAEAEGFRFEENYIYEEIVGSAGVK